MIRTHQTRNSGVDREFTERHPLKQKKLLEPTDDSNISKNAFTSLTVHRCYFATLGYVHGTRLQE